LPKAQWKSFRKAQARAELEKHKSKSEPRDERAASSTRSELDTFWKPIDTINKAANHQPSQQDKYKTVKQSETDVPTPDKWLPKTTSENFGGRFQDIPPNKLREMELPGSQSPSEPKPNELPEWVNSPEAIRLSLEDENAVEPTDAPPEGEDDAPP